MSKMCQACWVTPAKVKVMGADGVARWRCNTCAAKRYPHKAQTPRDSLLKKLFNKDTL